MDPRTWSGMRFAAVNVYCARALPIPQTRRIADELTLRTVTAADLPRVERLHAELRPGKRFSSWRRWTYRRVGRTLLWVTETPKGEFVGINMYYFREREWRDRLVHEAFIGVAASHRGQGLSNAMRAAAAANFTDGGVHGISTHIERGNTPSWRSAQRQGFHEVSATLTDKPLLIRRLDRAGLP